MVAQIRPYEWLKYAHMIIIALKANSNNFFLNQNVKMGKPTFMKNGLKNGE